MGQIFWTKITNDLYNDYDAPAAFTLTAIVVFIVICFLPFHFFYKRARIELLKCIIQIIISPFGVVRFRHFFFADILCSFVQPFKDLGTMGCFFFGNLWLSSNTVTNANCPSLENF